ncbi:MAG TPA: hypothetical protein DCW52_04305 [Gammaproteobacteria bacterium]|jgi:hypothetical protein|nr:hypothetical protein [Gammaproteobacteria bacterium]
MNHLRLLVSIGTVDFASTDIVPKSEKDKHPSQPILTTISFTPKLLLLHRSYFFYTEATYCLENIDGFNDQMGVS